MSMAAGTIPERRLMGAGRSRRYVALVSVPDESSAGTPNPMRRSSYDHDHFHRPALQTPVDDVGFDEAQRAAASFLARCSGHTAEVAKELAEVDARVRVEVVRTCRRP
jgi:hypothetical protein